MLEVRTVTKFEEAGRHMVVLLDIDAPKIKDVVRTQAINAASAPAVCKMASDSL